ncbi:uncharacterized protein [Procambarus clarkii]|uniref:uncharacterized protein n=1 Tax=Procambarus clarkii TaxID=6728 RepID=UPI0037431430
MVSLRAIVLALMGVVPVAWCLSLEGGRGPSLRPLSLPHRLTPRDMPEENYQPILSRQVGREPSPAASNLNRYDENDILRELDDPNSQAAAYRLQRVLSEAVGGAEGPNDLAIASSSPAAAAEEGVASPDDYLLLDPRYYLLWEYLNQGDEATGTSSSSGRRIRNSRNINSSSPSSTNILDNNTMVKRTWTKGPGRRGTSGLSLSIDASMKVLRQALYLEMARKKQRQQMQRVQHNQKLLNDIGKRDVTQQIQQERPQHQQQQQHQQQLRK